VGETRHSEFSTRRRRAVRAGLGGAVVAVGLAAAAPASANEAVGGVKAASTCLDGTTPAITITPTAWEATIPEGSRYNAGIRIDVTGGATPLRQDGVIIADHYEDRVVFEVPDSVGAVLTVTATAIDPWGVDGEFGLAGGQREATVTVQPCPATAPAPTPTSTPKTVPPEPDSEVVQVLGASVTRVRATTEPVVAAKVVVAGDAPSDGAIGVGTAVALAAGALALVAACSGAARSFARHRVFTNGSRDLS
jgi:hypothetical protein